MRISAGFVVNRGFPATYDRAFGQGDCTVAETGNGFDDVRGHDHDMTLAGGKLGQEGLDLPCCDRIKAIDTIEGFIEDKQRGRTEQGGCDRNLRARAERVFPDRPVR